MSRPQDHLLLGTSVLLALALLVATLCWQLPMMLWDQLDYVLFHDAWQRGETGIATLLAPYNGVHRLALPYLSMLASVTIADGGTWADGITSWLALVIAATIIIGMARSTLAGERRRWPWLVIVLLALHPGHLPNLQWGWQVQMLIGLFGAIGCFAAVSRPSLTIAHVATALVMTAIAASSFGTSVLVAPLTALLVALRSDLSWRIRIVLVGLWLSIAIVVAWPLLTVAPAVTAMPGAFDIAHYSANFIGSGIARFATDAAAWLTLIALAVAIDAAWQCRHERHALFWAGLLLFGLGSAVLTALGRVGPHGVDQAFAQRYVSLSLPFWIGWFGLLVLAASRSTAKQRRTRTVLLATVAVLACANALHLIRNTAKTHTRGQALADTIWRQWPDVDTATLDAIYFNQPEAARQRLELLHRYRFAPFDRHAPTTRD